MYRRADSRRLGLPVVATRFFEPLAERVQAGLAVAAQMGELRVDDQLRLTAPLAEQEDPELAKVAQRLDRRISEAQLPELIFEVDAEVA